MYLNDEPITFFMSFLFRKLTAVVTLWITGQYMDYGKPLMF
jgi:hypothetical protein